MTSSLALFDVLARLAVAGEARIARTSKAAFVVEASRVLVASVVVVALIDIGAGSSVADESIFALALVLARFKVANGVHIAVVVVGAAFAAEAGRPVAEKVFFAGALVRAFCVSTVSVWRTSGRSSVAFVDINAVVADLFETGQAGAEEGADCIAAERVCGANVRNLALVQIDAIVANVAVSRDVDKAGQALAFVVAKAVHACCAR